jgi:hypothetical protein
MKELLCTRLCEKLVRNSLKIYENETYVDENFRRKINTDFILDTFFYNCYSFLQTSILCRLINGERSDCFC